MCDLSAMRRTLIHPDPDDKAWLDRGAKARCQSPARTPTPPSPCAATNAGLSDDDALQVAVACSTAWLR